jgi:putative tricarboxylic transport membrane protein
MIKSRNLLILVVLNLFILTFTIACSSSAKTPKSVVLQKNAKTNADSPKKDYPTEPMEFIAPAAEGGGWDKTIREVAKNLTASKAVSVAINVSNSPGKGGAVYLEKLQEKKGAVDTICIYSPPLILNNINGTTKLSYKDTTPIARLISDYQMFVVKKDSKYKTLKDVIEAAKKDPKSIKFGGTSSAGSMDQVAFLIVAKAAGVKNIKDMSYTVMADVKSAQAQLEGNLVDIYSTGLADGKELLASGKFTALAVTSSVRIKNDALKSIPTCKELGISATFENWRGLFGPPDMPENARSYWESQLSKMVNTPEWKKVSDENGWDLNFADSKTFVKFIEEKNTEFKGILTELGLAK